MKMLHEFLTGKIIKAFYTVYNELQYGFLENIYEKALMYELQCAGFKVERQKPLNVYYKGIIMGTYIADLVVEEKVMLELKAQQTIIEAHEAQLLRYLRSTEIEVGLLLNFGQTAQFKRKVFANENKKFSKN